MRILIVDDSKAMRNIVMRTLRQAGLEKHEYLEAVNGLDALTVIRDKKPQLVLSDWNMPEMTGIELLEKVRAEKLDGSGRMKFGFVTSESSEDMRKRATSAGASFLIAKPFTAETVVAALGPLFGVAAAPAKRAAPPPSAHHTPTGSGTAAKKPTYKLQASTTIATTLTQLCGRAVSVKADVPIPAQTPKAVGFYKLDGVTTTAVCVCDLPLAASLAACLSLVPVGVVKESVKAGKLSDTLGANLGEVFNVLSVMFVPESGAHLKYVQMYLPGALKIPAEVTKLVLKAPTQVSLALYVTGYGAGKMSLMLSE